MKQILYIIILLMFVGCSLSNNLTEKNIQPIKFIFKKSMVSSPDGIRKLKLKQDSLIDATINPKGKDSLLNKKLKKMQMTDVLIQRPETEIHVKIQNDSIWRYTKQEGVIVGDYIMILKDDGILNYYDKTKSVNYRRYDLFDQNHEYEILENKEDRKEINGFDCYKVTLKIKDTESDWGNTIYELYVTSRIKLPVHSVINVTKHIPNTFPMEIRILEENHPGLVEQYELIELE